MSALAPIIALEGIDGSGKGTQAAAVAENLRKAGHRVELISFPRYSETFFGQRIGEYLNGEYGELNAVHPFLVSLLYAADRFESARFLQEARVQAELVILDRFVHSNLAHQVAKAAPEEQLRLRQWIERVEHDIFGLPRPDLVVFLQLPVDAAQELIRRKTPRAYTERSADLQEADVEYMRRVAACYDQLSREDGWCTVPVMCSGAFRPIAEITQDVLGLITERFL